MNVTRYFSSAGRLSDSQRISRGLLGVALLGTAMFAPVNPLGWFAVAALIAIVPIATAVLGECPVYRLFSAPVIAGDEAELSVAAQVELGIIGALLVGSVYVIPFEQLGGFAVFALMGLFPLLVALMGSDPIVAARVSLREQAPISYYTVDASRSEPAEVRALRTLRDAGREVMDAKRKRDRAA